jgi:hypothetical protein
MPELLRFAINAKPALFTVLPLPAFEILTAPPLGFLSDLA